MPDWKPAGRLKDPSALKAFRLAHLNEPCEMCERRAGVHVHHKIFRSQGGDDVESNWLWVCQICHDEAHGIRSFCY